jgi:hypothetical protein
MTLYAGNYLRHSITAKQTRIRLVSNRLVRKGHLLIIDSELMEVMRVHNDGWITVKRGIESLADTHRVISGAVHGDAKDFARSK